jgi:hypothetical protein
MAIEASPNLAGEGGGGGFQQQLKAWSTLLIIVPYVDGNIPSVLNIQYREKNYKKEFFSLNNNLKNFFENHSFKIRNSPPPPHSSYIPTTDFSADR